MNQSTERLLKKGKRILRYLRGTTGLDIVYQNNNNCSKFDVFSNSDWAQEMSPWKPISGGVLTLLVDGSDGSLNSRLSG